MPHLSESLVGLSRSRLLRFTVDRAERIGRRTGSRPLRLDASSTRFSPPG